MPCVATNPFTSRLPVIDITALRNNRTLLTASLPCIRFANDTATNFSSECYLLGAEKVGQCNQNARSAPLLDVRLSAPAPAPRRLDDGAIEEQSVV